MNARRLKVIDGDDTQLEELDSETTTTSDTDDEADLSAADVDPGVDDDTAVDLDDGDTDDATGSDDATGTADATDGDDTLTAKDDPAAGRDVVAAPTVPAPSHPRVAEAVRYLLDRYEMTSAGEFPSAITVVSALRKEGVTTISRSLAEVLSVDFGYTVCWVDVSWAEGAPAARRGLMRRLKRRGARRQGTGSRAPGILDVLGGDAALDDVMVTSPETHVAHLGAGRTSASLREITRGLAIEDLFDELKTQFDIVVFDSAPVAENSSALSLVQHAEAYVFVTQHGSTTNQQVSEAVRMLSPLPSMGAVLNSYRSRTPRAIRRFFPAER